jgi:hypothetical protein
MHLDSTTNLQLADARHRARVRTATWRYAGLEARANRDFLRRITRFAT